MGRNIFKVAKSFADVIVISMLSLHHHFDVSRHLKKWKVFAECDFISQKRYSTDFHHTYVTFQAII